MSEIEKAIDVISSHTQHFVPYDDLESLYIVVAAAEKLSEYETAEEDGRLVTLPCKAGDMLFCFSYGNVYPFKVRCTRIYEERTEIELWYAGDEENLQFWHITIADQDIGYEFFCTKEEAEKALKEHGE